MRAGLPDHPERLAGSTPLPTALALIAGAAIAGLAYGYGRWDGQRTRRIRAEEKLDTVVAALREASELRAAAAPPEHLSKEPPLRVLGRNHDDESIPGKSNGAGARGPDTAPGQHPGP